LKLPNFKLSRCSHRAAPNYKSVLEDNFPNVMQAGSEKTWQPNVVSKSVYVLRFFVAGASPPPP